MAFTINNLGDYTGVKAAAKATHCTVSQFEYRWYKLGLRSKYQFEMANQPPPKPRTKAEIKHINRALNNWRRAECQL